LLPELGRELLTPPKLNGQRIRDGDSQKKIKVFQPEEGC
jgi:hypothetical protein